MAEQRERKTVHVLDLGCGQALVRIPLIFRHEGKTIHYVGVDWKKSYPLDFGGEIKHFPDLEREGVAPLAPRFMAALKPLTADEFKKKVAEGKKRLVEEFQPVQLEFGNPELLREQIKAAVGDRKFDEIHFHMPDLKVRGEKVSDPESLKVVAEFLKPGGMLYHLFEKKSPFLPFPLESVWERQSMSPLIQDARVSRAFRENREKIREAVKGAGLELLNYGMKYDSQPHTNNMITSLKHYNSPRREKIDKIFSALAELYSYYGHSANNFFILRKPRNAK